MHLNKLSEHQLIRMWKTNKQISQSFFCPLCMLDFIKSFEIQAISRASKPHPNSYRNFLNLQQLIFSEFYKNIIIPVLIFYTANFYFAKFAFHFSTRRIFYVIRISNAESFHLSYFHSYFSHSTLPPKFN